MKHVVIIKSRKPSAFNYCKFGTYKNKKGKLIELVDPNGITTTGYEMFQAVLSLDLNDADASFKIFIKNCIDADVFSRVNGVYKYGTTTIGLTEDQSIMWLKDNADIMALLKNQLRGNVTEEVVSKKVIKEKVN